MIVAVGTAVVAFLQFGTDRDGASYVSGISLVITSIEGWLLTPWLTQPDGADQRGRGLRRR